MKEVKGLSYVAFLFDANAKNLFQLFVIWFDQKRIPVQEIAQLSGADVQYDADIPFAADGKNLIVVRRLDPLWQTSADGEVCHIGRISNVLQHFLLLFPRYVGAVVYELILRCAVVQKNIDARDVIDCDGDHLKTPSAGLLHNIVSGKPAEESHDL